MNELVNWDCLLEMQKIENKSIDCIIADIPYWTTACKWDVVIPFDKMWQQLNRIIKDDWAVLLFWTEPFASLLRISNLKNYKYDWYWKKNTSTWVCLAKTQPLRNIENILVFYKKNKTTL
jgi:site-specific DNA-methyltransferase (adenine-specific)